LDTEKPFDEIIKEVDKRLVKYEEEGILASLEKHVHV
jgi:hypothetical protein